MTDSSRKGAPAKKVRLDDALVARGLVGTAAEVEPLVVARKVKVGDSYATSVAQKVALDVPLEVKGGQRFVSRGGEKLFAALEHFGQPVSGLRCLDAGCSTGGFTDCLLQAGAAFVACVDVGYGVLDASLRNDPRTTVFERTNIRTTDPAALGAPFDLVVADLSFIGLARLAGVFAQLCAEDGVLLALVKPQFESAHDETECGLVTNEDVRLRTVSEVAQSLESAGFDVLGTMASPVPGKKAGNIEHFVWARKGAAGLPSYQAVSL